MHVVLLSVLWYAFVCAKENTAPSSGDCFEKETTWYTYSLDYLYDTRGDDRIIRHRSLQSVSSNDVLIAVAAVFYYHYFNQTLLLSFVQAVAAHGGVHDNLTSYFWNTKENV